MTFACQSPEDVINVALMRIAYPFRVANIYEGSRAAAAALDIYVQTRDELLRQGNWGFAERNVALTLLKQSPQGGYIPPNTWNPGSNPPVPWLFEYAYPDDCLKVRAVKPTPLFVPNFDPQPFVYDVANDSYETPPVKVILCNVAAALLVYTGQITDPTTWEADFTEAMAAALARRLAPMLSPQPEIAKLEGGDEAVSKQLAEMEQG
jgi:hypothetical protein